jgi:metal-responsive CopG/Arc/MetJ family transcriptional regulator
MPKLVLLSLMKQPTNQDDKTISLRIFMQESLRNTFKAVCAKQGKNMSEVVTEFIEEYIAKNDPSYHNNHKTN